MSSKACTKSVRAVNQSLKMLFLERDISPLSMPLSYNISFTDEHQRCPLRSIFLLWKNAQIYIKKWIKLLFFLFYKVQWEKIRNFLQHFKKCNCFKACLNLQFGLKISFTRRTVSMLFLPLKFSKRSIKQLTELSLNDDQLGKPWRPERFKCIWKHFHELNFHRILVGKNDRLVSCFL